MNRGASPRSVAVLVIDDDDDIRATLAEVLQEVGYSVASASHGVEALELLRDVRPSVILLDLNMPVMGGAEFRELQRKDALLSRIPTIVMTAIDRMPDSLEELEAEILAKPFRLPDLLALLEVYLGPATPPA
ncbi:MAG TPA: response regulator [Kofleriaceae bacterium]|nr:response regulator [Kofleriaceae bacterium]